MMEARDSSHQLELQMQAFYEHIRAGAGDFPLHQPSPLQQQQQQQHESPSPHQPHHQYHHQQQQQHQQHQQHQQPAHHLHHLHHLHHFQQNQHEQQLQENTSRNSFNPSMIHSPAPLRQMSPSPNFNPGPGPNLNPSPSNMNPSSSSGMSVCYPPETPPHMMPHQVQTGSPPSGVGGSMSPGSAMVPRPTSMCKKKRGRPRKYAADVNGSAALVIPLNSAPAAEKKGGGRGPSKKTQSLTTGATGHGFTPHVLTVGAGEDVTAKIMTFSQHGPWAVCILSANGAISNASLSHDGLSSSTVTYEGRFEILSLSGLFLLTEDGATRSRSGGFSVSLAGQDGRVIGGRVAGLLIAATPIQVVVGTFFPESRKAQAKAGSLEGLSSLPPTGGMREPPMQIMDKAHVDASEQDYVPEPPEGLLRDEYCVSNVMPLQSADWRANEYSRKPQ